MHFTRSLRFLFASICALCGLHSCPYAATITGTVVDPSNAPLPAASVLFQPLSTPLVETNRVITSRLRTAVCNPSGVFQIVLEQGDYLVTVASTDTFQIAVPNSADTLAIDGLITTTLTYVYAVPPSQLGGGGGGPPVTDATPSAAGIVRIDAAQTPPIAVTTTSLASQLASLTTAYQGAISTAVLGSSNALQIAYLAADSALSSTLAVAYNTAISTAVLGSSNALQAAYIAADAALQTSILNTVGVTILEPAQFQIDASGPTNRVSLKVNLAVTNLVNTGPLSTSGSITAPAITLSSLSGSGDYVAVTPSGLLYRTNAPAGGGAGTKTIARWQAERDSILPSSGGPVFDLRNNHPVLRFAAGSQSTVFYEGVIPEGVTSSDNFTVSIVFAADTATTGSVTWGVSVEDLSSQDLDADGFAAEVLSSATAVSSTAGVPSIATISLTNAQADAIASPDFFRLRVRNDVPGTSATGNLHLLAIELRRQ